MKRRTNVIPLMETFYQDLWDANYDPNRIPLGSGSFGKVFAQRNQGIAYKYGQIQPQECAIQTLAAKLGLAALLGIR